VFDALRGTGPYRIATTPDRRCSLLRLQATISVISMSRLRCHRAGAARAAPRRAAHLRRQPRRVVDHGAGTAAISFRHDSKAKNWVHWHSPGDGRQPYAVYVDESEVVWVND